MCNVSALDPSVRVSNSKTVIPVPPSDATACVSVTACGLSFLALKVVDAKSIASSLASKLASPFLAVTISALSADVFPLRVVNLVNRLASPFLAAIISANVAECAISSPATSTPSTVPVTVIPPLTIIGPFIVEEAQLTIKLSTRLLSPSTVSPFTVKLDVATAF